MSMIKTPEEQKIIAEGGNILGGILLKISKMAAPGVTLKEIDTEAERLIVEAGGRPAFKGYKSRPTDSPFPSTICASVNEELVHGIADRDKTLRSGDIFSIDIGMEYPAKDGFYTDTALTVAVGPIDKETQLLLERTDEALKRGIAAAVPGNSIADIGKAVEEYIKPFGYGIVRGMVGHGVGYAVHEPPQVPNYYNAALEEIKIEPGMVLALEPMITLGTHEIETAEDGWTVVPTDRSLCAHFEHTIIVTEDKPIVATQRG